MKRLFDNLLNVLSGFDNLLEKIERVVLVSILTFVIGLSFFQVILRNFFAGGFTWGDVFLRHMVLWLGLIGASIATKKNRHINIDIVSRILHSKSKLIINTLIGLLSLYICCILFRASINFISAEKSFGSTIFYDFPAWIFQIIFPVAFFIISYRFALNVINNLRDLLK